MILVLTTYLDKKKAQETARQLIKQNLAKCVNVIKIESSHYKWKGKLCENEEWLLIIKTAKRNYKRLELFIKNNHPYELPEIIKLDVSGGHLAYLNWVG
jgi:periplasmic divalent cation tolerance protein